MKPLDEDRARTLLYAAAETIDVGPAPVEPPARRAAYWPVLVAAAAVLLVLGLVAAVVAPGGEDASPAPAPRSTVVVPPVSTLPADRAEEWLRDLGLEVRLTSTPLQVECGLPLGRAVTTVPPVGATLEAGATVELVTTTPGLPPADGLPMPASAFCVAPYGLELVYDLLDLARGYDDGPEFASTVDVWVDGELVRTLSADEAADPAAWGAESALTRLVADAERTLRQGDHVAQAVPSVRRAPRDKRTCAGDMPAPLAGRPADVVRIQVPTDGISPVCHEVHVFRDAAGRIDAVLSSATRLPDIPDEEGPEEPTEEGRAVADAFLVFARGGPAPAYAEEVRFLVANRPHALLTAAEAADPKAWLVACPSGYAERSCPLDALAGLAEGGPVAVTGTVEREHSACHATGGNRLPADREAGLDRSVSLSPPEVRACLENWELQLWYDAEERIVAVNLLLGTP